MAKRSSALDILRAIAIILVLGRHIPVCPLAANGLLNMITDAWQKGGWVGVDLFFVISGFLISGLLFNEHKRFGSISFKHFFIRRGFKIYPPFYTLIAVTIIVTFCFRHPMGRRPLLSELFFLQDYIKSFWYHTWSLAVEEQFYLFLPILLICLAMNGKSQRQPFTSIPVIFISISLTCLLLRILTSAEIPFSYLISLFPFHLRIDSLFFGVMISYFYHYHTYGFKRVAGRFKRAFLVLGIALLAPAFLFQLETTSFISTIGLTLFYIGSGFILISVVEDSLDTNPVAKVAAYIGVFSYSIYLWHIPMATFSRICFRGHLPLTCRAWAGYAALYFFGAIFLGIFMSKIIELPMLRLRDRLYPSRSKSPMTQHVS